MTCHRSRDTALGVGGASLVLRAVRSADLLAIPLLTRASLDTTVLCFGVLITVGTALIVGLLPGLRAAAPDVQESLKAGAGGSSGKGQRRLTSALRPVSFLVDCALSPRRFITQLLGPFAVVALVLAALGIYGVIAASVTARTREIGIRMAPGAAPRTVRRQMLGEATVLALLGVAAGVAGAFAVSRIVSSLAFGVSSLDPIAFAAAPVSLLLVSVIAALVPALRAARTNPVTALRAE